MTEPAFTLPTDAEELEELRAAGLTLTGSAIDTVFGNDVPPHDVPHIMSAASFYLRRLALEEAELQQVVDAATLEIERVQRIYAAQIAAAEKRCTYTEGRVRELAKIAEAEGAFTKRKSLKTAWGKFGVQAEPARAKLVDQKALSAWAMETFPDALRLTLQVNYADYRKMVDVLKANGVDVEEDGTIALTEKSREVLKTALENAGVDLLNVAIPGIEVTPASTSYWCETLPVEPEEPAR